MKYRVQVKMIRNVQVEVELPAGSASWNIEGAAMCKAIEEYGEYDNYEPGDFEKVDA
jgi:hypothetical protein